jgi:hypothetical protein
LGSALGAAGLDFGDIVKLTSFVRTLTNLEAYRAVRLPSIGRHADEHDGAGAAIASDYMLEVDAIAVGAGLRTHILPSVTAPPCACRSSWKDTSFQRRFR